MKNLVLLLLIFLMGCTPLAGSESPTEDVQAASKEPESIVADEKQKLICERVKETGSHFFVKRCRTRTQLKREREESRRIMENSRNSNSDAGQH